MHDEVLIAAAVAGGISIGLITTPLLAMGRDLLNAAIRSIVGLVVVRHDLSITPSEILTWYLRTHGQPLIATKDSFVAYNQWVKKLKGTRYVFFKQQLETFHIIRYKGGLIWLRPAIKEKSDGRTQDQMQLSYFRWTVDWEQLLIASSLAYSAEQTRHVAVGDGRYQILRLFGTVGDRNNDNTKASENSPDEPPNGYTNGFNASQEPIGWAHEELGRPPRRLPGLGSLSMSPQAQAVVDDITFWKASEEWYKDRMVPWRRGYLLHGLPGTGKTSLVRGIAEELDLPIINIDLASCDNQDLYRFWKRAAQAKPCIILLEDIDAVFRGRVNVVPNGELTFDTLLNCIDGIEKQSGIVLFLTTNHLEHVDAALGVTGPEGSTRPGRVDMVAEIPVLDMEGRIKLAKRILKDDELAVQMSIEHPEVTGAQFQEICCQVALKALWNKKKAEQ